ncbi:MAG: autotransporter-associated beta strand repeat-containing protein, partial [Planctomycetia bacterium]
MSRSLLAAFLSLALAAGSGLPALAQTTTWNTAFTGTAVPNGETYVFVDGGSITPSGNPTGTLSIGPSLPSGTSSVLQFSYTGSGTSAAVLAGFGSVVVDGPGRVVFTNNSSPQSTPNGNLYLRSGTAVYASTNQAPSGTTVLQGGALQFSQGTGWQRELLLTSQGGVYDASLSSGNASQNSTVSGTGVWTLIGCGTASVASTDGTGIFYMNPTCNFTGTTTITGGKVYPSVDNAFGDSTQVGGSQANNKVILDGGSLFVRQFDNRNFVTAVEVGANGGYVDVYNNLTGQQGRMRFNAPISGTGQLTLLGQGSVFLTASNSFSGTLVTSTSGPNAGLQVNNVNALRNAELNLVGSGVLAWGGGSGPYYFGGLSGTKSIDGFSFVTGLDVGGNGRSTNYSGNIIDFQTLTKSGTGTLTFTGTSTLSQGTTIKGGVLAVNGNLALGAATLGQSTPSSAPVTLNGGTLKQTVAFNSARAFTIQSGGGGVDTSVVGSSAVVNLSGSFTGSGNLTLAANGDLTGSGTGNLALTGVNTYTGTTTITSGMVSAASGLGNAANALVLNGGGLIALAGTRTNSYTTVIGLDQGTLKASAASDVLNQAAVMSGSGGLRTSGSGTVNLQAANTFSGDTRTLSGTMNLAHANALQNSLLDMNGADAGTVGFTAGTTTYNVAGLQGSRGITFSSGTLSVGSSNASTTYSGPLGGTGRLVKVGNGDLTLTGTNSYAGGTVVSAGRLVGTTDGLQGTITNNAAVEFAQGAAGTYAGNLSGSGSVTKTGAGAVTLSGTLSHSGGTLVSAGSLIGTTSNLQGAITNNAVVEFAQATAGTYAGAMTGSGSVTKSGAGALTLTAASSYAGTTDVQAGTLVVNANNIGATGPIVLSSGATLAGNGTHGGAIAVNAGSTLSPGNSPGTITAASGTWAGGGNYN